MLDLNPKLYDKYWLQMQGMLITDEHLVCSN